MDPTTIVIPPVVIVALVWLIRGIVSWFQNEFDK
jgi:hypothetical protein